MFNQGFDDPAMGEAAAYRQNSNDDSDNSACRHDKSLRKLIIARHTIVRNHKYDCNQKPGKLNSESSPVSLIMRHFNIVSLIHHK